MEEAKLTSLDYLDQLEEIVLDATRIPFSSGRLVNEQEAIELIDSLRDSIPNDLTKASDIIKKCDYFINIAKDKSEEIVKNAAKQRDNILSNHSLKIEAEKRIDELQIKARSQAEQIIHSARQQASKIDQDMHTKIALLEQDYTTRRDSLENEAINRKNLLEKELKKIKFKYLEQHEINIQQGKKELDQLRYEIVKTKTDAKDEAERIHADALRYRHETQIQCDSLVQQARKDASQVQDGANKYADQTLNELENSLSEITKVVLAGRKELGKIQLIQKNHKPQNNKNSNTVMLQKAREKAKSISNSMRSIRENY